MKTKPTIAMIPSAYKDGKLFSVLPSDGSGDFDVTRSTSATRVNKDGIIELMDEDVSRLDYSEGGCPKLLLENTSTNLAIYSSDLTEVSWSKNDVTVIKMPQFGLVVGEGFNVLRADSGNVSPLIGGSVALTSGESYTTSFFVKYANHRYIQLTTSTGFSGNGFSNIDLLDKVVTRDNSGDSVIEIKQIAGTDWIRVSITSTATSTVNGRAVLVIVNDSQAGRLESFTANGNEEVYVSAAQIEESSFASSYIPTSGATITRGLDIVESAGNVNTFNDSEGTIFFEGAKTKEVRGCRISLNDGSGINRLTLIFNEEGDTVTTLAVSNGVNEPSLVYSIPSFDNTENNKYALTYSSEGQKLLINGVLVDSDSTPLTFTGLSDLDLKAASASSLNFFGTVKDYRYYNRALSNEELINLTN